MCFSFSSDVHSLHFIACTVSQRFPFLHLCQSPVEWWVIDILVLHSITKGQMILCHIKSSGKHLLCCVIVISCSQKPLVLTVSDLCVNCTIFAYFFVILLFYYLQYNFYHLLFICMYKNIFCSFYTLE